jgi:hypothetical protein
MLSAVPFSITTTVISAKSDYENWKKTQHLREKGVAEKFMPHKVRYDWSSFDERIQKERHHVEFTGTSKPQE